MLKRFWTEKMSQKRQTRSMSAVKRSRSPDKGILKSGKDINASEDAKKGQRRRKKRKVTFADQPIIVPIRPSVEPEIAQKPKKPPVPPSRGSNRSKRKSQDTRGSTRVMKAGRRELPLSDGRADGPDVERTNQDDFAGVPLKKRHSTIVGDGGHSKKLADSSGADACYPPLRSMTESGREEQKVASTRATGIAGKRVRAKERPPEVVPNKKVRVAQRPQKAAARSAEKMQPKKRGPKRRRGQRVRAAHARSCIDMERKVARTRETQKRKEEANAKEERNREAAREKSKRLRTVHISESPRTPQLSASAKKNPSTASSKKKKKMQKPKKISFPKKRDRSHFSSEGSSSDDSSDPAGRGDQRGPCGEDWRAAAKKLRMTIEDVKDLDSYVQENRKKKGERRLLREDMLKHIDENYNLTKKVKMTKARLSNGLSLLGWEFADPKVSRFEINREIPAIMQHLQRKVVFQELIES